MGDVDLGGVGLCAALQASTEFVALACGVGSVENAADQVSNRILFYLCAVFGPVGLHDSGFGDLGFDHEAEPLPEILDDRPHLLGRLRHDQPALASGSIDPHFVDFRQDRARSGPRRAAALGVVGRKSRRTARAPFRDLIALLATRCGQIRRDLERREFLLGLVIDLRGIEQRAAAGKREPQHCRGGGGAVPRHPAFPSTARRPLAGVTSAWRMASLTISWNCCESGDLGHRPFHRDRIRLDEELGVKSQQLEIQFASLREITGERRRAHFVHQPRGAVGGHRNDPLAAEEHKRESAGVIAAVDHETLGRSAQQIRAALDAGGGVFDADDVRDLCKPQRRFAGEIGDGPAGNVVHDLRDVHLLRDGAKVPVEAFLRGLVVVRHDRKAGIGACVFRRLRELDGFGRGISASAGHDGDAAARVGYGQPDQFLVFVDIDGGRFPRGPDDDDAVGTLLDVEIDERLEALEIEASVVLHRRNDRNQGPGEHRALPFV